MPDSLITEFQTQNKRLVYDGGGILPDINVDADKLSSIGFSLIANNYIFDYATEYRGTHNEIAKARDFKLSDQEYQAFVNWLKDKDLEYESASENQLDELIEVAKSESYYEHSKEQFEKLKQMLSSDREKDLNIFKPQISNLLEQEIVTRYYYQRGSIENILTEDKHILKAVEILQHPDLYQSILKGTYSEGNIKIAE